MKFEFHICQFWWALLRDLVLPFLELVLETGRLLELEVWVALEQVTVLLLEA
jgi:hypothetical protein